MSSSSVSGKQSAARNRKSGGQSKRQGSPAQSKKASATSNTAELTFKETSSGKPSTHAASDQQSFRRRNSSVSAVLSGSNLDTPLRDTPLSDFLSPFRPASTQWVARYAFVSFALIIRLAVGLGPYSGYKQEPLHGDFEAQRHWLEVTVNLPMREWYFHDLEWWGLDYPPLTAYHSWLLGAVARVVEPRWVELYTSRGSDDVDLKAFMRATALFSELAVYVPAVVWFVRWACKRQGQSPIAQSIAAAAILFQPALILIDHGHFQYNSVMLGLTLLAIVNLQYNNYLTGSFFFVLSICFKQMALYYAPIIFAYLLGICVFPQLNIKRLVAIGLITLSTFAIVLAPLYITGGLPVLAQCLVRVFPFQRGLWEDKVANVWCTVNTFVKLKTLFTGAELQRLSFAATLAGILPPMATIFFYPKKHLLPWAFAAGAWAFFLFAFQVHEKSVLVPLMPTTLLIAGGGRTAKDRSILPLVFWINNVAMFSLWPLLAREGLQLQFFAMTLCWNWLIGNFNFLLSGNLSGGGTGESRKLRTHLLPSNGIFWKLVVVASYAAMAAWHALELAVSWSTTTTNSLSFVAARLEPVLQRFPDLFVVVNVTISCACFGLFWLWNIYKLVSLRNTED